MKVSVIVYHKNITNLYKKEWIEKSFNSILDQSYQDFTIYELNYGGDDFKLYREYKNSKNYHYYKIEMKNHAEAMNFLLNECIQDGYDVVFNTNLDDISHKNRFDIQLKYIKKGYDLVSSNFIYIDGDDKETLKMTFSESDIKKELDRNNNVICHPGVCYSRNFLEKNRYITTEIPEEDLLLWKRTVDNYKFFITPEYLINYRIHNNQVTKQFENKDKTKTKKVGFVVIATNDYIQFLEPLIESADKYFLPNQEVTYFIFTNKKLSIKSNREIITINVKHKNWPWMTLGRYKIFDENSDILSKMDYIYYCDVDMRFVDVVGDEILSDRVATQHPGYYGKRGTPETNKKSLAYISESESMQYFAGGFNGGSSTEYLKMSKKLSKNIDIDYQNKIIAIWHDESHMNRYFTDNPPTKILSPSYCYAEDMEIPFDKKLLALDKKNFGIKKIKPKTKSILSDKKEVEIKVEEKVNHIFTFPMPTVNANICGCGEPKNRVKYNFCQKCNKLY